MAQHPDHEDIQLEADAAAKEAAEQRRKLQFVLRDGLRFPNTDRLRTQRFGRR